jgi:hypothetical protein
MFFGCTNLESVRIHGEAPMIGGWSFSGCSTMSIIVMRESVKSIGVEAFWECINLRNIRLPGNLECIERKAFAGCHSITSIRLPDTLKEMTESAFSGCWDLESVTIPGGIGCIPDLAFYGCGKLAEITVLPGIREIGARAFAGCGALVEAVLPSGITRLGARAFSDCRALTKAALPESLTELGVGLVSYSMTHHTRQSALGLPSIIAKEYKGMQYSVSEYTMSEIIGSIYDLMRETGVREGILFLDEINCVSETLSPCMLQFLQYKIFGQHRIPDGWIVVTAGNPPEYNKSVRDFDIVTRDRLKRIEQQDRKGFRDILQSVQ